MDIFETTRIKLSNQGLRIDRYDLNRPWGGFYVLDENQALKRALNINAIPHTIVTKGTRIIYRRIGYKPGEENHLYDFILKSSTVKN